MTHGVQNDKTDTLVANVCIECILLWRTANGPSAEHDQVEKAKKEPEG